MTPAEVRERLLDKIINAATFAADLAVLDAREIRTPADATRVAVAAAIRTAVANELLAVTDDAAQRLREGVRFQ